MPGHRRLGKLNFESFTFLHFQHLLIKKSYVFEWPVSWTLKQEHNIGNIFLQHIDRKKLTVALSARSPATRKSKFGVFYISIFSAFICQKKLRFRVACLMDTQTGA